MIFARIFSCSEIVDSELYLELEAIRDLKPRPRIILPSAAMWLNGSVVSALGFSGRATIPLGSNLGQVVYSYCLPSFSAPRNWGTKGSFRRLSGYGD